MSANHVLRAPLDRAQLKESFSEVPIGVKLQRIATYFSDGGTRGLTPCLCELEFYL